MVASDDESEHRSAALPRVVLVEVAEVSMSPWHRHTIEVMLVADSL